MTDKTVLEEPKRKICILPVAIDGHHEFDHQAILISWGLEFLDMFGLGNKLRYVRLPENWRFEVVEPDVYFKVVDEKGRDRIHSFTDIDDLFQPFMRLCNRYTIRFDGTQMAEENLYVAKVCDCDGEIVYCTDPVVGYEDESEDVKIQAAIKRACDWLKETHKNWCDPAAYWEE